MANNVNLCDSNYSQLLPGQVLEEWSKVIAKDVAQRKLGSIVTVSSNLHSIAFMLNQVVGMMGSLQSDVRVVKETDNHLVTTVAAEESELLQHRQEKYALMEENSNLGEGSSLFQQKMQSIKAAMRSVMSLSAAKPSKRACIDKQGTHEEINQVVGVCCELLLEEIE